MAELKPFEFFVLRYVPDAVKNEFANIGVVLTEPNGQGFADVRFTQDWRRVYCLDAQADVEWLMALERDIRAQLNDVANRHAWMKRVQESFSGMVQLSPATGCLAEDPAKELLALSKLYLETPGLPAVKRVPTGRQLILRTMNEAFGAAGVGGLLLRDVPVEEYTKRGDPFKFDFGYQTQNREMKWLQAVSMKASVESAITLAARYQKIADKILEKKGLDSWLTTVVDDNLDQNSQTMKFALEALEDGGIRVVEAHEMAEIARVVALELRA